MAITFDEYVDSPAERISADSPGLTARYWLRGETDAATVKAFLAANLASSYNGLAIQDYTPIHMGNGVWEITVGYSNVERKAAGDSSFQFEIGGGSERIYQSKETKQKRAKPGAGEAIDFKGAINVSRGGEVDGVDIIVPSYSFSETHYFADASITTAYKLTLFQLSKGKTNRFPWRGFAVHEVLFLGASGSKRGAAGDWEITYKFTASPNVTGLTIGDITQIDKEGHDYVWVFYDEELDPDANDIVKRPIFAYVERVYDDEDFTVLGIGS